MGSPSRSTDRKLLGWGIDDPFLVLGLIAAGTVGILIGFVANYLSGITQEAGRGALIAGAAAGMFLIGFGAFLGLNSSVTKYRQALIVARALPFGGNEMILDVGCGRGAFSVVVAAAVPAGTVVGTDVWDPWHITGNSPRSLAANAASRGVGGRVSGVKSVGTSLPFSDAKFDVVVSCLGLQHVGRGKEFDAAVGQMARALKEGGWMAILSTGYGRRLRKILPSLGMTDVRVTGVKLGFIPVAERVIARKAFTESA